MSGKRLLVSILELSTGGYESFLFRFDELVIIKFLEFKLEITPTYLEAEVGAFLS